MTTQVAFRTDDQTKKRAMEMAKSQGVSLTFVVNSFLKQYAQGGYTFAMVRSDLNADSDSEPEVEAYDLSQYPEILSAASELADYVRKNPPV